MQYFLPQKLSLNYDSLLDYFLVLLTQIYIFKCKVLYCKNSTNYLIVFPNEIHPKKCNMLFLYTENGKLIVPFLFKFVYRFYLSYINSKFMSFAMVNNKELQKYRCLFLQLGSIMLSVLKILDYHKNQVLIDSSMIPSEINLVPLDSYKLVSL